MFRTILASHLGCWTWSPNGWCRCGCHRHRAAGCAGSRQSQSFISLLEVAVGPTFGKDLDNFPDILKIIEDIPNDKIYKLTIWNAYVNVEILSIELALIYSCCFQFALVILERSKKTKTDSLDNMYGATWFLIATLMRSQNHIDKIPPTRERV